MDTPEAVPQAGGSYVRDEKTGALTKTAGSDLAQFVSPATTTSASAAPQAATAPTAASTGSTATTLPGSVQASTTSIQE